MKIIVGTHLIKIEKEPINEKEINITKCEFEFADTIPEDYAKKAFFTYKGTTYEQLIQNNECDIPYEVLDEKGQVEIGVIVYKTENDEYIQMYNPSPAYFETWKGSLKEDVENSSNPTPSEIEQIESELAGKQDMLVSGENIKTINNESILGSGNIHIEGGSGGTSDYEELENKPSINNIGLIGNKSLHDLGIQAEGNYALRNEIPTNLSQLTDDANHRLTTDAEKQAWNNKSDFSGSYNDLTNKPELFSGDYDDLTNKPTIPTVPTNVSAFTNDAGYLTSETDPVFSSSVAHDITSSDVSNWNSKQAELVSGTNIKTINNESILGSGNITIEGGGGSEEYVIVNYASLDTQELADAVDIEYQKFRNGEPYHIYYQGPSSVANVLIPLYFYYQFATQPIIAGFLPTKLASSSKKVWAMVYISSATSNNHITRVWGIDAQNMNLLNGNYDLITTGNTVNYIVSGDYNPAHKKYVDDKPTTWSGYDATKTQILKNVNGTLTWVDDYSSADNTSY